jgi:8-oxo-dGTP pyrophosphatase MutT (NUDIX family)
VPRALLSGSRVPVVAEGRILLVHHRDAATGRDWWVLPGGGREPGETFAASGRREVYEETGIRVRRLRRLHPLPGTPHVTYALFVGESDAHAAPRPTVDLSRERLLINAAWHAVTLHDPLGPLDPALWSDLAPVIPRKARCRLLLITRIGVACRAAATSTAPHTLDRIDPVQRVARPSSG